MCTGFLTKKSVYVIRASVVIFSLGTIILLLRSKVNTRARARADVATIKSYGNFLGCLEFLRCEVQKF